MATTPKIRPSAPIPSTARGARSGRSTPTAAAPAAPAVVAAGPAAARKPAAGKTPPAARKTAAPLPVVAQRSAVKKAPAKAAPVAAPARKAAAAKKTVPAQQAEPLTPAKAPAKKVAAVKAVAKPAVAKRSAVKPVVAEPVAVEKVVAKKALARKAVASKVIAEPVTAEPVVVAPVAAKKALAKKAATKKAVAKPAVVSQVIVEPVLAEPVVASKAAARKATAKPTPADKAIARQPKAPPIEVVAPPVPPARAADAPARKPKPRPAPAPVADVELAAATVPVAVAAAPVEPPAAAPEAVAAPAAPETASTAVVDLPAPAPAQPRSRQRPPRRPAAPVAEPAPVVTETAQVAAPTGPAHSAVVLIDGDQRWLAWQPGHACPPSLLQAAQQRLDDQQHLPPDDDSALPTLLRLAAEAGHALRVDDAVWPYLAAHRDARTRLALLEAAYADGPAGAGLRQLLRSPLPQYQAEGALFAVVAGRALIADERGLGKGVQAIAAAALWRRHFGVERVLVLCAPAQRAAWQRAWRRFDAGSEAQLMDGGLHQRQALWSTAAGVRILSPEALASDAAHLERWAPDLIVVDEPQHLALRAEDWAALQSPHALVLCGAPLAEQPALMDAIVGWLDDQGLGPLAALHELQSAAEQGRALSDADIERLTASLSRLMLQRSREDLHDQLPALVHSERLVVLAPGQRDAHDRQLGLARRLLAGWQRSGYLSDADQWRLSQALRAAQLACQRADPTDPASALAEATVQALAAQLALWQASGPLQVALLCASSADRDQLAAVLDAPAGVQLLLPTDALPAGLDAVLQAGVPWRTRRSPAGPRGQTAPGQQWLYLVAQDSLEAGLFDTLAQRTDAPRGLGDGEGGRAYLQGERLADWLGAIQAAIEASAPGLAAEVPHA